MDKQLKLEAEKYAKEQCGNMYDDKGLTGAEQDDFHQVYTLGQAKLNKTKLNKNAKTVISKSI